MSLSGIKSNILQESSRIDFLQKDFTERVSRKYDKFLKFYNKGIWDKEKEPDNFIKNVVSTTSSRDGKIISKDTWIKFMLKQFNKLIQADPTENKQYLNWLVNIYLSGNLPEEDIYKIPDTLKLFSKNKEKLPIDQRNINSFTNIGSLYGVVLKYDSPDEISASEKEKLVKLEGAEQVYDSPEWKIIIPKTEAAACLYGKNTKWCTASEGHSQFNYYNKQGPLYILIDKRIKDDRNKMKKLQFHFESNQFMDSTDVQINITHFFKSNIEIMKFFESAKKIDATFKIEHMLVSKKEGLALLKSNKDRIQLIKKKGYKFFEDFYIEIGAKDEFKNVILDNEFIKFIFDDGKFIDLMGSYVRLGMQEEGLVTIQSLPWINEWILSKGKEPKIIESFIISIVSLGNVGKNWAKQLIQRGGIIWNTLIGSGHIAAYFNIISHTKVFGTDGVKMVKQMLSDKDIVKELKSKGMTTHTFDMINQFYNTIKLNKEARIYYKNILS